jgi:hypothetical protein
MTEQIEKLRTGLIPVVNEPKALEIIAGIVEEIKHDAIISKFIRESGAAIEHAQKMTIKTDGDATSGTAIGSEARIREKLITEKIEPLKSVFNKAHKQFTSLEKELLKPWLEVQSLLGSKISAFHRQQEEIRRREQWKLEQAALITEAKAKEKLEKSAEKLLEKGQIEKAEMKLEEAEALGFAAPVLPEVSKKIETESGKAAIKKDIEVEVVNLTQFLQSALSRELLLVSINVNLAKLKALCKDYDLTDVPGLKIREVTKTKFRG